MTVDPRLRVTAYVAAAPDVDADHRADLLPLVEEVAASSGRVLLATCHRVELYIEDGARLAARDEARLEGAGLRRLIGIDAARQVVSVALGLRSAVLAEDQIIHQLRSATARSRHLGPLGADLDLLLDVALRAGRIGRSWRPAQAPGETRSLADAAIERILDVHGSLRDRTILVVGAGRMGEAAVVGALRHGARAVLTSPSVAHARSLAEHHGSTAWPLDPGPRLAEVDAVVVALAGPWRIERSTELLLAERSVVVDLSMPPALSPTVRRLLAGRLIDIDALARPGTAGVVAAHYQERLERLAERTLAGYVEVVTARDRSGADRLAERIERQRAQEVAAYLHRRPDLDLDARRHLDAVTRDLAARLFRVPLQRLGDDPDGRRRRAADDLFGA